MLIIRRVVFYLFLGIYLILCPALLLYCFGYIINPITREVEQTGLIYLSTIPPGANVYLGRSRFVNLTPTAIDKLDPAQYTVTLGLPGYKPWSQTVDVKAGKASAFEHILMVPRSWTAEHLSIEVFKQLIPLPGTDYILAAQDANLGSYFLIDWKTGKTVPLLDRDSPYFNFTVLSLFHEDGSRVLILYGGGLWERKYLYVGLKGDAVAIADITKLLSGNPLLVQWDPQDENNIFAVYANHIDRLDVAAQALYPKFLEDVKGCGFSNNRIFLLTGDNNFKKLTPDKSRTEPFLESLLFDKTVLGKNLFFHISVPAENMVFLMSEEGQLLTNTAPYQLEAKGVIGMEYNERERTLLYWTTSALKTARLAQQNEDATQKMIAVDVVFDKGTDIKQSYWMLDDTHLIFNDNDQIFLLEVEPQGSHHVEFIANLKKNSALFYANGSGSVYYLDEAGRLEKIQLMPKENVVVEFLSKGTGTL